MRPTFTVLIGSIGRASLRTALDSIAKQRRIPGDQVIVALDAFEQTTQDIESRLALVQSYGNGFDACAYIGINGTEPKAYPDGRPIPPDAPYHWLGVEQINHAMRTVPMTGSHVFTIGDDDIFVDDAYDVLRATCAQDPWRPVIYRFVAPNKAILWDKPRLRPCLISGCCIAAPRQFVGLMHTRIETTHDYDWIVDVLKKAKQFSKSPVWLDYVGVVARPDSAADATKYNTKTPVVVDEVPNED